MKTFTLLVSTLILSLATFCQSGELVFQNPVLISGTANTEGARYRFSNVTTGVDAIVKIKKFSRPDIVMSSIDLSNLGWNKAFQPQFGLPGTVAALQTWSIDFEMSFYQAGTNTKEKLDTIDLTALDVDGDGQSIREFVTFDHPASITYASVNALNPVPLGTIGQLLKCSADNITSALESCSNCGGDGLTNSGSGNNNECQNCEGSGRLHSQCDHAYQGVVGTTALGPVTNFTNIDTSATQVMSVYRFLDKDKIKFTYGAQTSAVSSSAGIRLNSTWFKRFDLAAPLSVLPVTILSFTAQLNNNSNKVDLKWLTDTESNLSHYMVERSLDGENFSDIGMVFAAGNTTGITNYEFIDNISSVHSPVIYYRFRWVNPDGSFKHSIVRIIKIGKLAESITITTYPNPVTNELRVTIPANWQNKKVVYELFSSNGQAAKKIETTSSSQTETLNVSILDKGLYIIRVSCDGKSAQQKIIKH